MMEATECQAAVVPRTALPRVGKELVGILVVADPPITTLRLRQAAGFAAEAATVSAGSARRFLSAGGFFLPCFFAMDALVSDSRLRSEA
jgi:hypothetical protein